MGRRHEQTFLQRRPTRGQQAHEKMLHITCDQRNTNQNHNEIPPHTSENGENEQDRKQSTKLKDNLQNGRRYSQMTYQIKG